MVCGPCACTIQTFCTPSRVHLLASLSYVCRALVPKATGAAHQNPTGRLGREHQSLTHWTECSLATEHCGHRIGVGRHWSRLKQEPLLPVVLELVLLASPHVYYPQKPCCGTFKNKDIAPEICWVKVLVII